MIKFLVQVSRYFPTCALFQATWKQDKAVISSSVKSSTSSRISFPLETPLWTAQKSIVSTYKWKRDLFERVSRCSFASSALTFLQTRSPSSFTLSFNPFATTLCTTCRDMTIIAHLEAIIFLCKCITNQSSFSSINTKATFQPTRIVKNPSSPKTEKEPYGIPQRIPSNTFKEMNSFPRVPGAEGINYGGDK